MEAIHGPNYPCEQCYKSFASPSNLISHIRTHSGEKPFVCKECSKSFLQVGHQESHMRTHSGQKPFVCQECSTKKMSERQTKAGNQEHSLTLDMLNNFCFHVCAQKSLFIGENGNESFLTSSSSSPSPVSLEFIELVPS